MPATALILTSSPVYGTSRNMRTNSTARVNVSGLWHKKHAVMLPVVIIDRNQEVRQKSISWINRKATVVLRKSPAPMKVLSCTGTAFHLQLIGNIALRAIFKADARAVCRTISALGQYSGTDRRPSANAALYWLPASSLALAAMAFRKAFRPAGGALCINTAIRWCTWQRMRSIYKHSHSNNSNMVPQSHSVNDLLAPHMIARKAVITLYTYTPKLYGT